MNLAFSSIDCLALQKSLVEALYVSIATLRQTLQKSQAGSSPSHVESRVLSTANNVCTGNAQSVLVLPDPETIPLQRVKGVQVSYRSAIALKLASTWSMPAETIVRLLVAELEKHLAVSSNTEKHNTSNRNIGKYFSIEIASPGQLFLRLSDAGTAVWLQTLIEKLSPVEEFSSINSIPSHNNQLFSNSTNLFAVSGRCTEYFLIQYAYGRCCSLIRLSEASDWLSPSYFKYEEYASALGQRSTELASVPESLFDRTLFLKHPNERQLVSALIQAIDAFSRVDSTEPDRFRRDTKTALALSKAFQEFYAHCRLFDPTQPSLQTLARLELVGATRGVLRFALVQRLGIAAPDAL